MTPNGSRTSLPRFIFMTGLPCGSRCLAQEVVSTVDAELGGIQNDQDFGHQRFDQRLAGLAAEETGHVVATLAQQLLEPAQHGDSLAYGRSLP